MKRRKILIGLGLLALPVVLLCIVFQKQLAHTWKEIVSLTSNNPHEYRSRTLRRPVIFTNQMFIDSGWYKAYHFNPESETIEDIWGKHKLGRPYLKTAKQYPHIEDIDGLVDRPNGIGGYKYVDELPDPEEAMKNPFNSPKDWPEERPVEIAPNSALQSTLDGEWLTLTNKDKSPIHLSTNVEHSVMLFVVDENGNLYAFFSPMTSLEKQNDDLARSSSKMGRMSGLPTQAELEKWRHERNYAKPISIKPNEALVYHIPNYEPDWWTKSKLKCSLFFVIVGENDKIIHIFETPSNR